MGFWAKNEGVVCACEHEMLIIGREMGSGIVKMGKNFGHVGHLVRRDWGANMLLVFMWQGVTRGRGRILKFAKLRSFCSIIYILRDVFEKVAYVMNRNENEIKKSRN